MWSLASLDRMNGEVLAKAKANAERLRHEAAEADKAAKAAESAKAADVQVWIPCSCLGATAGAMIELRVSKDGAKALGAVLTAKAHLGDASFNRPIHEHITDAELLQLMDRERADAFFEADIPNLHS